jgi:FlaA1/EpsC-like NDP-sugar epimerase
MTRYFMLIPEAVSLVLQAGSMGNGGELSVLDMGAPVNITGMAETLIRLHGREPYKDIGIVFTGIRQGEKLFEELFYDPDHVDKTSHDKIFLSKMDEGKGLSSGDVKNILNEDMDEESLRRSIFSLSAI